jgi:ABC-type multidrug transport system ATPase subunit
MKSMELIIEKISKRYRGNIWGLRDYSLELGSGVLGLLGPNGAGKTTLMNILATITKPTNGTVSWNGKDIAKDPNPLREVIGYLPQSFGVYENLTAVEFLEYLAAIKNLSSEMAEKRIPELLELVNLADVKNRPLRTFSGGMKQRIGIAQALLNDPKLLIVDEPTVGLDPEERVRFRNLIADLSGERIIILSTHIVSDVESAATEIATISHGRGLNHTTPESLIKTVEGKVWEWLIPHEDIAAARERHQISASIRRSHGMQVRVVAEKQPEPKAKTTSATLEDAYLFNISQPDAE